MLTRRMALQGWESDLFCLQPVMARNQDLITYSDHAGLTECILAPARTSQTPECWAPVRCAERNSSIRIYATWEWGTNRSASAVDDSPQRPRSGPVGIISTLKVRFSQIYFWGGGMPSPRIQYSNRAYLIDQALTNFRLRESSKTALFCLARGCTDKDC